MLLFESGLPDEPSTPLYTTPPTVEQAVAAERERCARIADDMDFSPDGAIAKLIRAGK